MLDVYIVASRWCRASGTSSKLSGLLKLSRGVSFLRLVALASTAFSAPRSVISWTASVEPVFWDAPRLSLLLSLLQRWVGSTAGAAILYLLSCPDVGGLPSISLSVCHLSLRPSLPVPATGPLWSACTVIPIENSKAFLMALTRLLAMTGSLPHRSHARQTTLCTLHATTDLVYSVSYRLELHIWPWWSEVVASPPTDTLHISLTSSFVLPTRDFVRRGSRLTLSLAFKFWLYSQWHKLCLQ